MVPAPAEAANFQLQMEERPDAFATQLLRAAQAFVVRRGNGRSVIAGYPWFLDWGRDTFICARGLLAAGMAREVKDILLTFARFEKTARCRTRSKATTPRIATPRMPRCGSAWSVRKSPRVEPAPDRSGRRRSRARFATFRWTPRAARSNVLRSIAQNYMAGTSNGIRMDAESALIWSPAHLHGWIRIFRRHTARRLSRGNPGALDPSLAPTRDGGRAGRSKKWRELADRALASVEKLFWLEERGLLCGLPERHGRPIRQPGHRERRAAQQRSFPREPRLWCAAVGRGAASAAAQRYLVVPGALRSLAPLPVSVPLPVMGSDGRPLNDPANPYWGIYDGDEDTCRKPAYHNGTAWTWTFPGLLRSARARGTLPRTRSLPRVLISAAWNASARKVASARLRSSSTATLRIGNAAAMRRRGSHRSAARVETIAGACGPRPVTHPSLIVHILIAPNAFKNSLDAGAVAKAINAGLRQSQLKCTRECFPVGDGGGGTGRLLIRKCRGQIVSARVHDPLGRKIQARFGLIDGGKTAVIEMADASGLRLLRRDEFDPVRASSAGTGEVILRALEKGVRQIIIGVGGSATVDGGVGTPAGAGRSLPGSQIAAHYWCA